MRVAGFMRRSSAQPVPKTACRSGRRDKHNRPRWDSNPGPLTPQSDALTTGRLRLWPAVAHTPSTETGLRVWLTAITELISAYRCQTSLCSASYVCWQRGTARILPCSNRSISPARLAHSSKPPDGIDGQRRMSGRARQLHRPCSACHVAVPTMQTSE